ncbi:hypothetical protein BT69DRAFT_1344286 [Atractiella rhizophila]|nr:hypothetical protein BT69DRAFT_1344286 [Atractiella rhizophila]
MSSETPDPTFVPWEKRLYQLNILPVIIGASIGFILFGISLYQFFHVFKLMHDRGTSYSTSWWILMALFWISFGDTVNKTVFYTSYMQSVALDGPHLFFIPITRSTIPSTIFQGILTVAVQLLYIYRILRIIRGIEKFNPSHQVAKFITYV